MEGILWESITEVTQFGLLASSPPRDAQQISSLWILDYLQ